MMTRQNFRTEVLSAINENAWFISQSIRAIDLDFSPEAEKAVEEDLRDSQAGAVVMVSQILEGKAADEARRGRRINREVVVGVVALMNPEKQSDLSHDELVDRAIMAVIGREHGPGNRAFTYLDEKLEQHPGAIRTLIRFKTSTIIDTGNE